MRSRQHCYGFQIRSDRLGDIVSQGIDDRPMPKDHLDIEMF